MKERFAVLTSGGDAPGMNATSPAVGGTGLHLGYEVIGVHEGFKGLPASNFRLLTARDLGRNCGCLALAAGIAGGAEAIVMPEVVMECLHQDENGVLVGLQKGQVVCTPYALVAGKTKGIDPSLVRMIGMLAA